MLLCYGLSILSILGLLGPYHDSKTISMNLPPPSKKCSSVLNIGVFTNLECWQVLDLISVETILVGFTLRHAPFA